MLITLSKRFAILWDIRFWRIFGQVIFAIAVFWIAFSLWNNLTTNLQKAGIQVGFDFLNTQASFDIGEGIVPYRPTDPYSRALLVGFVNTLRVTGIGIVLSTIVGLMVGIARLSDNWLVQRTAIVYVEVFRNTPLLLQFFFWYFAGFANFPKIEANPGIFGLIYFTNRGLAMPGLASTTGTGIWLGLFAIGGMAALWLWRTRSSRHWAGGAILMAILSAIVITQTSPFVLDIPKVDAAQLVGGLQFTPEFGATLIGVTLFIGSFIAEIVRAGIQSVPKGQWEAAKALGLKSHIILRRIVLPQALRVSVPPLTSQYLYLAKGTSLAIAIGYPELYLIANTTYNQTGHAVEVMIILMTVYLSLNLIISMLMNGLNRALQIKER